MQCPSVRPGPSLHPGRESTAEDASSPPTSGSTKPECAVYTSRSPDGHYSGEFQPLPNDREPRHSLVHGAQCDIRPLTGRAAGFLSRFGRYTARPVSRAFPLGKRIIVAGQSCSGKSTLGAQLAHLSGASFVELDALFWKPNWEESSDEEFQAKLRESTAGDSWVVAGNYYARTSSWLWERAETIIWLDFSWRSLAPRIVQRSWQRWRRDELLWGTNKERFWPQLKLWSPADSLIAFGWQGRKSFRERQLAAMTDPRWAHVRFVRLRSRREVNRFLALLETGS